MSSELVLKNRGVVDLLPPGVEARYRVIKQLGEGGMGVVWLAEDQRMPRQVAIKGVREDVARDPVMRERIERECEYHARIGSHPNIVTLLDKIEEAGRIVLIMEYVPGRTLAQICEEQRDGKEKLSVSDALSILIQVTQALDQIHRNGIVHRDIKPDNVMVHRYEDGRYWAKLMDFGISRLALGEQEATRLTQAGSGGPGTPTYMAPEQIDSATFGAVGPATDIYAVGAMLYRVVAGAAPFSGTATEVFTAHLTREPPPLEALDDAYRPLSLIVRKAMAKRPEDRYSDAQALADALSGLTISTPSSGPEQTVPSLDARRSITATAVEEKLSAEATPHKGGAGERTQLSESAPRRGGRSSLVWIISLIILVGLGGGSAYIVRDDIHSLFEPDETVDSGPVTLESAGHRDTDPTAGESVDSSKPEPDKNLASVPEPTGLPTDPPERQTTSREQEPSALSAFRSRQKETAVESLRRQRSRGENSLLEDNDRRNAGTDTLSPTVKPEADPDQDGDWQVLWKRDRKID